MSADHQCYFKEDDQSFARYDIEPSVILDDNFFTGNHGFEAGNAQNWQSPLYGNNSEISMSPAQTEFSAISSSSRSCASSASNCSPSSAILHDIMVEPTMNFAWLNNEHDLSQSPINPCETNYEALQVTDNCYQEKISVPLPSRNLSNFQNDQKPMQQYPKKRRISLSRTSDACSSPASSDTGTSGEKPILQQEMKFFEFQQNHWQMLCDINGQEMPGLGFQVVADKGFIYSPLDNAFVNQKKNHFQISAQIENANAAVPKFVKVLSQHGVLRPIKEFELNLYGVKTEMLSSIIQVKQFQSDRKATDFEPIKLDLVPNRISKVTVGRLHFNETTMNNQRKSGAANPNQRYFSLVAALNVVVQPDERYTVIAYCSDAIIVRASNPGQFGDNSGETSWQRGKTPESMVTQGPVGIGTDKPASMLSVAGDIQYTGTLYHPSDARLKENIEEIAYDKALSNLGQIRFVTYDIKPEMAQILGVQEDNRRRVGVLAQEVADVLPDAVKQNGEFLTVDDNRIFYESAAAVKELCRLTGNLESKIGEVEKISKKLSKFSRDSLRSSINSLRAKVADAKRKGAYPDEIKTGCLPTFCKKYSTRNNENDQRYPVGFCGKKVPVHCTITALVVVMLFCICAICTLYVLDRVKSRSTEKEQRIGGWNKSRNGNWWNNKEKVEFWKAKDLQGGLLNSDQEVLNKSFLNANYPNARRKPQSSLAFIDKHKFFGLPLLYPCQKPNCPNYCCRDPFLSYEITDQKLSTNGSDESEQKLVIVTHLTSKLKSGGQMKSTKQNGAIWQGDMKKQKRKQPLPDSPQKKVVTDLVSDIVDHILQEQISPNNRSKRNASNDDKTQRSRFPDYHKVTIDILLPDGLPPLSLDSRYAANEQTTRNLSYYVPISEFMPFTPVTVRFSYVGKEIVQYCDAQMGNVCSVLTSLYELTNTTFAVHEQKGGEWSLPVGLYQLSSYKFRIGKGDKLCNIKDDQESKVHFFEYNLVFYRICRS